jgi:hypothetical protein
MNESNDTRPSGDSRQGDHATADTGRGAATASPEQRAYEASGCYPAEGKAFRLWALIGWLTLVIVALAAAAAVLNIYFLGAPWKAAATGLPFLFLPLRFQALAADVRHVLAAPLGFQHAVQAPHEKHAAQQHEHDDADQQPLRAGHACRVLQGL